MKKLMHILFLSCLKATELIEKKAVIKLSMREEMQLSIHKMMCEVCKCFETQSVFLEKNLLRKSNINNYSIDIEQFKDRLKANIRK